MDNQKQPRREREDELDEEEFDQEEFDEMELLERRESLRADMADLVVSTLAEVNQRIAELHKKLDSR